MIKMVIVVCCISILVSSCEKQSTSDDYQFSLVFGVIGNCLDKIEKYKKSFDSIEGMNLELNEVNYTNYGESLYKYFVKIESNFEDVEELKGYANGMLSECDIQSKIEFNINDDLQANRMISLLRRAGDIEFAEIDRGQVKLYEVYQK